MVAAITRLAERVQQILGDDSLQARQSAQAAENGSHYGLELQVDRFLEWYTEILAKNA